MIVHLACLAWADAVRNGTAGPSNSAMSKRTASSLCFIVAPFVSRLACLRPGTAAFTRLRDPERSAHPKARWIDRPPGRYSPRVLQAGHETYFGRAENAGLLHRLGQGRILHELIGFPDTFHFDQHSDDVGVIKVTENMLDA